MATGVITVPAVIKGIEIGGCTSRRVESGKKDQEDIDFDEARELDGPVGILDTGELVARNEAGYYIPYPYVQYQELGPSRLAVFGGPIPELGKELLDE